MKNIRIIETGIDVSKILEQLEQYPEDWGSQKNIKDTEQLDSNKYTVTVDVLQLIMGGIAQEGEYVGNTEICIKTPAYERHTEILKFVNKRFKKLKRCGFLSLPVVRLLELILMRELIILQKIDTTFPFKENTGILLEMKL